VITVIMLIAFSFVAGVLYRLGGIGKPFNTKYRDFGVPIIYILYLLYSGTPFNVYLIASAILLFISLTTYWKCVSRWLGQSTENVHWYNWLCTGLVYGLAGFPLAMYYGNWHLFALRVVLLSLVTMCWSESIGDADLEEVGRGFFIIFTLGIL